MTSPALIDEISVEWLNALLRRHGIMKGDCIGSFDVEPVPCQGMTSLTHILTLRYNHKPPSAPSQLIAKFSLDNEMVKDAFAANRGFEREVDFYNRFGGDAGIPIPHCYWAQYDKETNSCGILMEYVGNTRATTTFTGTIQEIEQVVDHLAPFHARWWQREHEMKGVYPGQAPFMVDTLVKKLKPALENINSNYRNEVGETLVSLLELWIANAGHFAKHQQKMPQTLCHGDLHREQILFPADAGDPFCVIDWQLSAIDSGPADLAHLLTSGLRPEQRRQHEHELLERYFNGLVQHGVTDYSQEQMMDSFRLGIARFALFYLSAFSMGDISPIIQWWENDDKRKGFSFWDVIIQWPAQALEKHGVIEYLTKILRNNRF